MTSATALKFPVAPGSLEIAKSVVAWTKYFVNIASAHQNRGGDDFTALVTATTTVIVVVIEILLFFLQTRNYFTFKDFVLLRINVGRNQK